MTSVINQIICTTKHHEKGTQAILLGGKQLKDPHSTAESWWRHQMETLLTLCAGHSPATGEFPARRPATRSFDVVFDLRLDKRLSKQS